MEKLLFLRKNLGTNNFKNQTTCLSKKIKFPKCLLSNLHDGSDLLKLRSPTLVLNHVYLSGSQCRYSEIHFTTQFVPERFLLCILKYHIMKHGLKMKKKNMAWLLTTMQICCTGYNNIQIRCSQFKILAGLIVRRLCHPHIKNKAWYMLLLYSRDKTSTVLHIHSVAFSSGSPLMPIFLHAGNTFLTIWHTQLSNNN